MILLLTAPVVAQDQTAAPDAAAAAPMKKMAKKTAAGDEAGIKKAFEGVSTAWASGDAEQMIKFFTADSSLINPMGNEGWGKTEVQKIIAGDLQHFKGTTQTFDNFKFVFIMPSIALVDCEGTISGAKNADGTDAEPTKVHVYGLLVNRGKGWQARSIRVTAFLKPPSAATAAASASSSSDSAAPAASETPAADKATDSKKSDSDSMNK